MGHRAVCRKGADVRGLSCRPSRGLCPATVRVQSCVPAPLPRGAHAGSHFLLLTRVPRGCGYSLVITLIGTYKLCFVFYHKVFDTHTHVLFVSVAKTYNKIKASESNRTPNLWNTPCPISRRFCGLRPSSRLLSVGNPRLNGVCHPPESGFHHICLYVALSFIKTELQPFEPHLNATYCPTR